MTTLTITDYLKYANLQMAAEAFIRDPDNPEFLASTGNDLIRALIRGNDHASKFTQTQAEEFAAQWKVVDQRINSTTGFSGTLFRNRANPSELVLSFRSTEFIDDTVRDNLATNTLEIKETGWAWGQLADMEAWYNDLRNDPAKLGDKPFSVTGYSLGGHLATAFNLLHGQEKLADGGKVVEQVITFNGAGVGLIESGQTLDKVLQQFTELRNSTEKIIAKLEDADLKTLNLSAILNQQDPHTHQTANQPDWRLRA